MTEPPVWLWICEDKETELKATQLAGMAMFTANYVKKYSKVQAAGRPPGHKQECPSSRVPSIPCEKVGQGKVQHPDYLSGT